MKSNWVKFSPGHIPPEILYLSLHSRVQKGQWEIGLSSEDYQMVRDLETMRYS